MLNKKNCLSLIFETEATLEWELLCHLLVSPFVYLTLLWDIWNPPAQYKTFAWQVGPPLPLMDTAHVKKSCWTQLILSYIPEELSSSDLITYKNSSPCPWKRAALNSVYWKHSSLKSEQNHMLLRLSQHQCCSTSHFCSFCFLSDLCWDLKPAVKCPLWCARAQEWAVLFQIRQQKQELYCFL